MQCDQVLQKELLIEEGAGRKGLVRWSSWRLQWRVKDWGGGSLGDAWVSECTCSEERRPGMTVVHKSPILCRAWPGSRTPRAPAEPAT